MLRRSLISLVVALAALGSVVQGVHAAAPTMGMGAVHADAAPFCDGCAGADGEPAACGSAVCPSAMVLPSSVAFHFAAPSGAQPDADVAGGASQTRPPDPFPPRPLAV
ncbi:MAG TPA: hypothetical protein VJM14_15550 [Burkholderiales bacterium]|nr:hypothetical protein [Burkholderiales bacterium]